MNCLSNLSDEDLQFLEDQLASVGAATHVTVPRLLRDWSRLADEAADYRLWVDDYTNDLTGRDLLAGLLTKVPQRLRDHLLLEIADADERFRNSTIPDDLSLLARYYRIDPDDGWWWHRIPQSGSMAAYLSESKPRSADDPLRR